MKLFGRRQRWDLEVDVLALGSGLGGLTAAIVAHDLGRKVAVLDKSPKLGGVCAYSGGETFNPNNRQMREAGVEDSEEAARRYVDFIAAGFNEPELTDRLMAMRNEAMDYLTDHAKMGWVTSPTQTDYYFPFAPGSHEGGRYLVMNLFSGAELGEWQARTHVSPHHPMGLLHTDLTRFGGLAKVKDWDYEMLAERVENDQRSFGTSMMGYLIKAAMIDRGIPAYVDTPARELITDDDGAVIGVRAEREGRDFFVRASQGVVMCIGGYDHNAEMATASRIRYEWESASSRPTSTGDNIMGLGWRDRRSRWPMSRRHNLATVLRLQHSRRGALRKAALPHRLRVRHPPLHGGEPRRAAAFLRRVLLQGLPAADPGVGRHPSRSNLRTSPAS